MGQDSSSMKAVSIAPDLTDGGLRNVYVNAPFRPVGLLRKSPVRAWFSQSVAHLALCDLASLRSMEDDLRTLVETESTVVGAHRVILAGFSQGAAVALSLGLRHPARLGGIALYAPFLLQEALTEGSRSPANAGLPVWIGHGRRDWTVPMRTGELVRDTLGDWGYQVSWNCYPGGHEPFYDAAADLRRFIETTLLTDHRQPAEHRPHAVSSTHTVSSKRTRQRDH